MQNLASILIFIIPVLGLIAGLSLGVTIPLFMMTSLYLVKDNILLSFTKFRLELVFFLFLLLSCLWSINSTTSFISVLKSFSLVLVTYILITNIKYLSDKIELRSSVLIKAIIGALVLFYLERFGDGFISLVFRKLFQVKESHQFLLSYLDRGCTLLALFSWVVIAELLRTKKNITAILLYQVILVTLSFSDSLSAFVGFIIAGIVFLLTKYSFFKNPRILATILLGCTVIFIYMAASLNPYKVAGEAEFLPYSAKHRLFIWDYVAKHAMEKPIFGWGHASSRDFDVKESEIVDYAGELMDPLPTHPHNNILQILLENGLVGLVLYMALACKYLFQWNNLFDKQDSRKGSSIRAAGYACFSNFFIISMISFNMWQNWWVCSFLWVAILLRLVTSSHFKSN